MRRNAYTTAPDDVLMVGIFNLTTLSGLLTERHRRFLRRYVPPVMDADGNILVMIPRDAVLANMPIDAAVVMVDGFIPVADGWTSVTGFESVEHGIIDDKLGLELESWEYPEEWDA
jgi:hypothetical protein